ncbi:MAG: alpha/beta hydrolase family protein [Phycisphaerae bacterium]|jgi:dienelactone hydrolase|nr:alpha/beta hydrolase family protein [Phycisphaerae bacterium]
MAGAKSGAEKFYSIHPHLRRRWGKVGRKMGFDAKSVPALSRWRGQLRRRLKELLGYNTMQRAPLRPKIVDEIQCDGYTRQKVHIQTEPGVIMPMYVLIPDAASPPYSAVLCPHGHCAGGKIAVAGVRDNPEISQLIDEFNYDYGVQFARAGYIAFCPDARGFGERREESQRDNLIMSSCTEINNMAIPLGQTVTGMWTWDLHRLIDYVQGRRDCRKGGVGCAGLSGGGLQTLYASALDERIRCAVISGYFYGVLESLVDLYINCSCNYVPHLWEYVDMGDIGALIAPRPLLIETGTKDELNGASGVKNVKSQLRIARKAYRILGAGSRLAHDVFEAGHQWHGTEAIPWMKKWLV